MNPQDFLDLLDGLPDEMLCDANDAPRIQPRRLRYMLSALAACAVLVIAAAVYPRLRQQKPLAVTEPVQTTGTAASTQTDFTQTSGTDRSTQTDFTQTTGTDGSTQTDFTQTNGTAESTHSARTESTKPTARTQSSTGLTETQTTAQSASNTDDTQPNTAPDTTAAEDMTTGETDCTTEANLEFYTEQELPFRIIAQRAADPQEIAESRIYAQLFPRALPDSVPPDLFPELDFSVSDCLLLRVVTGQCGAGQSEELYSGGRFRCLRVVMPAVQPDSPQLITLAIQIPKQLEGWNVWRRTELPVPGGAGMYVTLLNYSE